MRRRRMPEPMGEGKEVSWAGRARLTGEPTFAETACNEPDLAAPASAARARSPQARTRAARALARRRYAPLGRAAPRCVHRARRAVRRPGGARAARAAPGAAAAAAAPARSPLLIDSAPNYLRLPRALKRGRPTNDQAHALCAAARAAIETRAAGDRRYLARFEAALAEAHGGRPRRAWNSA